MLNNPLSVDLDYILKATVSLWDELRGQRLFMTGGTGFFGSWLLESFVWANAKLNLNATAVILTRDPKAFAEKCPHLVKERCLEFHQGDVNNFDFPEGEFSHVIHAATEASAKLNESNPLVMLNTILQGTKRTLEFAKSCHAKRFLLTSSGAVYGRQLPEVPHLFEEHPCQPKLDDPKSAYAVGKCTAEHMACLYGMQYGFEVKIARCFAFVGPYLPLDIHFAIGNFIRDGLNGGPIIINGDGTPCRSYLYAADLAIWLWTILCKGKSARPYNVGSDEVYSIADLACLVAETFDPKIEVIIKKSAVPGMLPERYVPSVQRAREELHLSSGVHLINAVNSTKQWYSLKRDSV